LKNFPVILRWCLFPLAVLYWLIIEVRNFLYDHHVIRAHKFSVPVISIGNLTVGGTGKTPFVIFIAQYLLDFPARVGIVSRGYGRKSKGTLVVHDGSSIQSAPDKSGDEAWLMASALKSVPVIVDEHRSRGVRRMVDEFQVDVILLDDAFQRRQTARDVNILLMNSQVPLWHYHLLPVGRLREPLRQSRRADIIVHTKCPDHSIPVMARQLARFTNIPNICSNFWYQTGQYQNGHFIPADIPRSERIFAFCGIGDPESFRQALTFLDILPAKWEIFPDHQKYPESVVNRLRSHIESDACSVLITTEKDRVKLPSNFCESFSIYIINIIIKFRDAGDKDLTGLIRQTMDKKKESAL